MRSEGARRFVISCAFIAAAGGLRFFHLENQSLWNDEMFSVEVAAAPISAIQSTLAAHYHHPPLFFYLLHIVFAWFGPGAWTLRLISAAAGSLTVGLVFWWCSGMFGMAAGLISGAICLFSPFHLAYSQEGRPYALAALLALASCCSLQALLTGRKLLHALLYAATSLSLLYTHHWGIFLLASQGIFVSLERGIPPEAMKRVLLCWLTIVLLYLPNVPSFATQSTGGSSTGWFWVESPGWSEPLRLAGAFSGTYFRMASSTFDCGTVARIAGIAAGIGFLGMAIASWLKDSGNRNLRAVLACFGGTLLLPFLISFIKPEVFLWYRYTVIVIPLLCIALGGLATGKLLRGWGLVLSGVLLAAGLLGSSRYFSWSKSNVRDVALYADTLSREGVNILIRPQSFAPLLNYYYRGTARQYDEVYLDKPLGGVVDTASAFLYISLDVPSGIRDYMDGHFVKTAERRFPGEAHLGMVVTLYKQPPDEEDQ
jgi:4-amino-4-deoxy-L-arabinose transferase-like glycosyltransferase